MAQKHKPFREFRTPFPLRDIRENPRSNVRACAAGDGAICSKNRKIVPYHGANPGAGENTLRRLALFVYLDHPTKNDVTSGKKKPRAGKKNLNAALAFSR